jgi:predicted PurR-regulated permease PerM
MKRLALLTAVALATVSGIVVLWKLYHVLVLLVLSMGLTAALRPIIDRAVQKGLSPMLGIVGVSGLGFGGFVLLIFLVSPLLLYEMKLMSEDFTKVYSQIAHAWPQGGWLERNMARLLSAPDRSNLHLTAEQAFEVVASTMGLAFNILGFFFDAIIVVVLSVYWNINRVSSERLWLSLLPLRQRLVARDIWRSIETEVGAYLRSELAQSLIAGIILGLGCWLIGFRYPASLAVIAALCWLVPWIGILLIVAVVIVLSTPTFILDGHVAGILVGGSTMILTQAIFLSLEFTVEPRFFNRRRYNSLITVLVVILLADNWGILGLLLGPPLAVAIQVLGEQLLQMRVSSSVAASAATAVGIEERMSSLNSLLAAMESPPPELMSLVKRLNAMLEEAAVKAAFSSQSSELDPMASNLLHRMSSIEERTC